MLWLNILCKCSSIICDIISVYKHGSFNKQRQNFNKNIKIRKRLECVKNDARWFPFQQDGAPAHPSHHTVTYLCSHVPEFIEPENWPQNSPDLNPVDYSVWGVATDDVSSQNFRHWPAEMRANRLLGSAKLGYVKSSDRSAAKKTDDGYQGQGYPCWISSGLNMWVNNRCCFIVC